MTSAEPGPVPAPEAEPGDPRGQLDEDARDWLRRASAEPDRLEDHFAAAGRHCGRRYATGARIALLAEVRPEPAALHRLYEHGTAAERVAVLGALHRVPAGGAALPLVEDALRSNDPRLIAAALGPCGAAVLPAAAWRQAVLKCLFTGVPLSAVHGLADRAAGDAELARMLRDFAAERQAAGRSVPADLTAALDLTAAPRTEES